MRWSIVRHRDVGHPAWSPGNGYRVAYLEGRALRLLTGSGVGDHLVAGAVAPVTPAWRPGAGYVLSYVTLAGDIVTRDVYTGRVLWTAHPDARPSELEWSAAASASWPSRPAESAATGPMAHPDRDGLSRPCAGSW